ncbi:hypothetical protein [Nocardioides dilutus]
MTPAGTSAAGPSAEPTTTHGEWSSVGEALATRSWAVVELCRDVGRDLAERGIPVGDALRELRSATRRFAQRGPTFEECEALVDAWADATLGYLNRISCADPLTGLDSQAHLLAILGAPTDTDLIMVVVELPDPLDFFVHARHLSLLGDLCRTVFPAARTTARVGVRRLVTLIPAEPDLGRRVSLLVRGADGADRVWVEPIPPRPQARELLIDRLART